MKYRTGLESFLYYWTCFIVFLTVLIALVFAGSYLGLIPLKVNFSLTGTSSILVVLIAGLVFVAIWLTLLLKMKRPTTKVLLYGFIVFALSTLSIYYQGLGFSLNPIKVFSYSISFSSGLKFELDFVSFVIAVLFLKAHFSRKNA